MQPNISSYLFVFHYVFVLTGSIKSDKNLKMNKYEQLPFTLRCMAFYGGGHFKTVHLGRGLERVMGRSGSQKPLGTRRK